MGDIILIWWKLKKKVYLRVNGVLIYLINNLRFSYYASDTKSEKVISLGAAFGCTQQVSRNE